MAQQAGRDHGPIPITWKTDNIRVLGTNIGNVMSQDWEKPTKKVETILKRWNERQLTLKGKAVILRAYVIATIVYLASMFMLPENYITRIQNASFRFLWSNKNELVSRETCYLPMMDGGLGIPDIHTTKTLEIIKWIRDLTNRAKTSSWLAYGRYWTGQVLGCTKDEWQWLSKNTQPHGEPDKAQMWYAELIQFVIRHRGYLQTIDAGNLTTRALMIENHRMASTSVCCLVATTYSPAPTVYLEKIMDFEE